MDTGLLRAAMREGDFYPELCAVEECESTNLLARQLALQGAPEGTAVFAGKQTAGRGRMGRRFQSPAGGGLYMSVLLRPTLPVSEVAVITACAAVAVAEAVEELYPLGAEIKWVNDLLLDGRKFCGILTESVLSAGGSSFLVLGIGINVSTDTASFPEEVRRTATSLYAHSGIRQPLEAVAAAVLDRFAAFYRGFPGNLPQQRDAYCARLTTLGKTVEIAGEEGCYTAVAVDSRFGLVVEREGLRRTLSSGEVSVRAREDA